MWAVILLILKIIGFTLLGVLGLALLLLAFILAVPIRYQASTHKEESFVVTIKVTWLLRMLTILVERRNKVQTTTIKVLGKALGDKKAKPKKTNALKDTESDLSDAEDWDEEEGPEEEGASVDEAVTEEKTVTAEETMTVEKPAAEEQNVAEEETAAKDETAASDEETAAEEKPEAEKGPFTEEKPESEEDLAAEGKTAEETAADEENEAEKSRIAALSEKLADLLRSFRDKMEKLAGKFDPDSSLMKKLDLIDDLRSKRAIGLVIRQSFKLLKHIFPHKGFGYIRFGLEDPSMTGMIIAFISAAMPAKKDHVRIEPDFSQAYFDGDGGAKGRIYLGYVVYLALVLILNKDARFFYKAYKNL